MKLSKPKPALKESRLAWVEDFPAPAVKLIDLAEDLGASGLILPVATGIASAFLTRRGICLTIVMTGAVVVHARRKEPTGMQMGSPRSPVQRHSSGTS